MPRSRTSIQWDDVKTRPSEDGGDEIATDRGELVFDAVTAQTRDLAAELPEHPVEDGVANTDHVIPQPNRISFEAHVSTAVFDPALLGDRRAVSKDGTDLRVIAADSPRDRAADALTLLEELKNAGTTIDIIGLPYGDLESYQIRSISATQSGGTGEQLVPTIEARQRVTATVSEVDAPAPRVERTRRRRDQGQQDADENEDENENENNATAARNLLINTGLRVFGD